MTTLAELYSALKYRVVVDPHSGARKYYNALGRLHCEEGPAFVRADGTEEWWQNGQLHREDGPAVVDANGASAWYQNGRLHREDGPAVVWPDSVSAWWFKGVRHRIGGAAVIYADGTCYWFLQGRELSEEEFDTARADTNKMM